MDFNATLFGYYILASSITVSVLVFAYLYFSKKRIAFKEAFLGIALGLFPPLNIIYAAYVVHKLK